MGYAFWKHENPLVLSLSSTLARQLDHGADVLGTSADLLAMWACHHRQEWGKGVMTKQQKALELENAALKQRLDYWKKRAEELEHENQKLAESFATYVRNNLPYRAPRVAVDIREG
jgi:hypothetical protein